VDDAVAHGAQRQLVEDIVNTVAITAIQAQGM